jgi:outer membrane murein-binding lipoprotein Lpp
MKRPLPLFVSLFAILFSPLLFGQQPDDAQSNAPADNVDMVTQIQQLRADVERLSQQVDRLSNEVKSLQGPKPLPAKTTRSKTAPAPVVASTVTEPASAPAQNVETIPITVLVFRDGRRVETRNYAIVGESIWVYTELESKKYRVADLDVEATKKVNSDEGVQFQLPPTR